MGRQGSWVGMDAVRWMLVLFLSLSVLMRVAFGDDNEPPGPNPRKPEPPMLLRWKDGDGDLLDAKKWIDERDEKSRTYFEISGNPRLADKSDFVLSFGEDKNPSTVTLSASFQTAGLILTHSCNHKLHLAEGATLTLARQGGKNVSLGTLEGGEITGPGALELVRLQP